MSAGAGANVPPQWTIIIVMDVLDDLGGATGLLVTLVRHLRRGGHRVAVYTEHSTPPGNQYAQALRRCGVPFVEGLNDRNLADVILRAWAPVRVLVALLVMAVRRCSFRHAWLTLRARLRPLLPQRELPPWRFYGRVLTTRLARCRTVVHVQRGTAGLRWAAAARVPAVYVENSVPTRDLGIDKWWDELMPQILSARAILVGSTAAAAAVRTWYDYTGPVPIVPWIVDEGSPAVVESAPRRTPVIGVAARLSPEKGQEWLLRALPAIHRATGAHALLAGNGPLRDQLVALADRLGVGATTRFAGRLTADEMEDFWRTIDLLVVPSLLEGGPLVAIEAMARRVPVVACDVGAIREILDDGRCGCVVPARDPEALASAVIALLNDPAQRRALSDTGYARYQARHCPAAALPHWLRAYDCATL